jgi:hypothetical protein
MNIGADAAARWSQLRLDSDVIWGNWTLPANVFRRPSIVFYARQLFCNIAQYDYIGYASPIDVTAVLGYFPNPFCGGGWYFEHYWTDR